ncbi:MAG: KR domain-containing protein, partial [bacterium]|nr:KR domain-containing protein [bacterium]
DTDMSSPEAVEALYSKIRETFGAVDGIIHTTADNGDVLAHGIGGTLVLAELLKKKGKEAVDFLVFLSPISRIMGMPAELENGAVSDFFNAFAVRNAATPDTTPFTVSINWDPLMVIEGDGFQLFNSIINGTESRVLLTPRDLTRPPSPSELQAPAPGHPLAEEQYEQRSIQKRPYEEPRDKGEHILAEMVEDLLGIKPVGIHDDFFELGGNSLKGITLVDRLKDRLGEIIHVTAVFDAPTVAELAAYFKKHYSESFIRMSGETPVETGVDVPMERLTEQKIFDFRRAVSKPFVSSPVNG